MCVNIKRNVLKLYKITIAYVRRKKTKPVEKGMKCCCNYGEVYSTHASCVTSSLHITSVVHFLSYLRRSARSNRFHSFSKAHPQYFWRLVDGGRRETLSQKYNYNQWSLERRELTVPMINILVVLLTVEMAR